MARAGRSVGKQKKRAAPASAITPARATPPDKAERVTIIEGMMRRFEWERGVTGRKLAAEWGMREDQVRVDAAEASRRVEADADEVRREVTSRGVRMLQRADEEHDAKGFAAVGKLLADVSGANAAKRVEITVPREEKWANVRAWFANPTPELEAVLLECGWTRSTT